MSRKLLMVDGEKIPCPVCWLVRNQTSHLELTGASHRPTEDKGLLCRSCGRKYESVRWFYDYFVTRTVPRIEAEMVARNTSINRVAEERNAEWAWKRERKATRAIEEGTWNPMGTVHLT